MRGDFEGWRGQLYTRVWLYIVQSHLMYLMYVREVTLRGGGEHVR